MANLDLPQDASDLEFRRLRERVRRDYPVAVESLSIDSLTLSFTRVKDVDVVLQRMDRCHGDTPPWQPYWAEAWISARAVAEVLVEQNLSGVPVLDLGCGLGLTGAVAAAKGARVLMADAAQPALLFARLNSWPWRERVRLRALNWRTDSIPDETFRWIIGSDVLYEREEWAYLERFWRAHLATGGNVLLGEPGRRNSDDFVDWLSGLGWTIRQSVVTVEACRVRIFDAGLDSSTP